MRKLFLITVFFCFSIFLFGQAPGVQPIGNSIYVKGYVEARDSTETPIAKMDIIKAHNAWAVIMSDTVVIGTKSPATRQLFNVDGAIQIGNSTVGTPGAIRYTGTAFEGYTGGAWGSMGGAGGGLTSPTANENIYYTQKDETWTEADNNAVSKFRNPQYYLAYWYADFYNAWGMDDKNEGNSNILMLGDSYGTHYSLDIKYHGGDMYGYGGGYRSAVSYPSSYYDGGLHPKSYDLAGGSWRSTIDRNDTINFHNHYMAELTNGEMAYFSARYFSQIRLNYRDADWAGTFTVRLGKNGSVLQTIDCNLLSPVVRQDTNVFVTVNLGKLCQYPYDSVYLEKTAGDTVHVFGWALENTYTEANYGDSYPRHNKLEVHDASDGGNTSDNFYVNKDTANIRTFLEEFDISLLMYTTLDAESEVPTPREGIDSLLRLCQYLKPDMSILVISPNDEQNNVGLPQRYWWDSIAHVNNWAYLDFNNIAGSYADLSGSGLMTDNTHLSSLGNFLTWQALQKVLFPYPENIQGQGTFEDLYVLNSGIKFPNSKSIYINSGLDSTNYWDLKNTETVSIGYWSMAKQTSLATDNTSVGYRSGYFLNNGKSNTLIGNSAGDGITIESNNTAVGYSSGNGGVANTSIGSLAGASFGATSSGNIAVGESAASGLNGIGNIMIGVDAGASSHTINYCIGIGTNAAYQSGSQTTDVGFNAGRYNTGAANNFYGYASGNGVNGVSNGANNCAFGGYTLNQLRGGGSNSVFGGQSFRYNTSGDENSAIGAYTGSGNTTGSENSYLGYQSGFSNISGDGNVFLGYQSGYNETGSNKLYIENSNSTSPLIYGEFDNDFLEINGTFKQGGGSIADNDVTPDVSGANIWTYGGNANAVTVTSLDNPEPGVIYTIIGISDTYTIRFQDSGEFNLSADFTMGANDVLSLFCISDTEFIEVSRSNN